MRRTFKRVGSFLLAIVMCLSLLPVSALAFDLNYDKVFNGGVVVHPKILKPDIILQGDVLLRINRSLSQLTDEGMAMIKYDYDHSEPAMPIIVGDIKSLMNSNMEMFNCTMTESGS